MTLALFLPACAVAQEAPQQQVRQQLSDAWWTGPILAASPNTLPEGHWYVEPYVYDVMSAQTHAFGNLTYLLYGLLPRFTVGVIPTAGYTHAPNNEGSMHLDIGDLTAVTQFRLTKFREGSLLPTTALVVREVFPTGRYDNLGNHPSDGLGAGAYTTELGFYAQDFFWLPNGRILRTRFDVTQSVYSTPVTVNGVSVYGTGPTFHGQAEPGLATSFDAAFEYSITRRWVFACDAAYGVNPNTAITGANFRLNSGSSTPLAFAPAIEYNWTASYGVIAGTRIIPAMRNTTPSTTVVAAVSLFL